jgi:segregation and condensation protein B
MTIEETPPCSLSTAALVESLLFVASAPVSVRQLSEAIGRDVQEVESALQVLGQEYQDRGLRLQRRGDQLQMVTAPESAPCVERLLGLSVSSSLSGAAVETLAIIAYKQPITRPEIEAIRGVSSDGVLRTLVSKGLVEEVGRLETVGRPILFGTTFELLQYFGLSSLSELPPLEPADRGPHDNQALSLQGVARGV